MVTDWKVSILPSAQSALDQLDDPIRREAMQAIRDLTEDPFRYGSIPLRGHPGRRKVVIRRVPSRQTAYQGL